MTVTKELIDKIVNGENSVASDEVIDLLYQKASEQLDAYKKEYASQLMNPTEEEPEVEETITEPTEEEQ
jgi:hypothetical protein